LCESRSLPVLRPVSWKQGTGPFFCTKLFLTMNLLRVPCCTIALGKEQESASELKNKGESLF
jgi:hypothetical protein